MARGMELDPLLQGVLRGDRRALARAITLVENGAPLATPLLRALFPRTGRAHLIGITGPPGTGKSTLVSGLARAYRGQGLPVAVVAVDPTSPFSGGALLGDRVRMGKLSGDPGIFIRSMASRGSLGGLAAATSDVILVLEAAGFPRILVETVGVGQAEVEIARTAHTTVVVEAPGLGDEVQAIKAGVLEIADILVVNKADRPSASRAVAALETMLHMGQGRAHPVWHHGQLMSLEAPAPSETDPAWEVPVLRTIATAGEGVEALHRALERHREWLWETGHRERREQARMARAVESRVLAVLGRQLRQRLPGGDLAALVARVSRRELDPHTAAETLLQGLTREPPPGA